MFFIAFSTNARAATAFSNEVATGSREENASKQESRASVLIQSKPIMLEPNASCLCQEGPARAPAFLVSAPLQLICGSNKPGALQKKYR